jgi:glycosyltransferase involved in cell wall biosynthesis
MKEPKRALWLINHKTLMNFEVPLLINLGYEVFVPKNFPMDTSNTSAWIDYKYDDMLTIPKKELNLLNAISFYEHIPLEAVSILNKRFGIAFVHNFIRQLKEIMNKFNGVVIYRVFGTTLSYSKILREISSFGFINKMHKIKDRFYFGQGYDNISEREEFSIFRDKALDLPIGIKRSTVTDTWKGANDKMLFICPQIAFNAYYKKVYEDFISNFGEYDYIIGGAQPIDPHLKGVTGYMADDMYKDVYENSRFMFYHSTEKYHVHYHPFEAVACGLPLLFMGGGMLDRLGGKGLPGRCKDMSDAKKKAKRLIKGDQKLIDAIRETQPALLEIQSYDWCRPIWETSMRKIDEAVAALPKERQKKRVAVVLNEGYLGGILDYTLRFLDALERGRKDTCGPVEFVFGYLDHPVFADKNHFKKIEDMGIPTRKFKYIHITKAQAQDILRIKYGKDFPTTEFEIQENYAILDDGMNNFNDCDFIIFTTDRLLAPLLSFVPYCCCVHDFIQRYLPEVVTLDAHLWVVRLICGSEGIFVTTPFTFENAIGFGGLPKWKIKLIPSLLDDFDEELDELPNPSLPKVFDKNGYFIWSTNVNSHKNHKRILDALNDYYQGGGKIKCYVTGIGTDGFDPKSKDQDIAYVVEIRDMIRANSLLDRNIKFMGNMSKPAYLGLLKSARFLLHGALMDNGSFSVYDAAWMGVPSISSRYPPMEFMQDLLGLNLRFFDPYEPKTLLKLLRQSEYDYAEWAKGVPSKARLLEHTVKHRYMDIYNAVADIIGF